MHTEPWRLYDDLIDLLPDVAVESCTLGEVALVTTADGGCGMASRQHGGPRTPMGERRFAGRKVRDVASLVRSWDVDLASLGVAALNCCLNTTERVAAHGNDSGSGDVFTLRADELRGRKVTMVGHFRRAVDLLEGICSLTVLERNPHGDDLPDSACEYLLPGSDVVFITGMTVANKTLPMLLELSALAHTVLTGPRDDHSCSRHPAGHSSSTGRPSAPMTALRLSVASAILHRPGSHVDGPEWRFPDQQV